MDIKVQKQVRLKANVIGLDIEFFYPFIGIAALTFFFIVFDITFIKVLGALIFLSAAYFILLLFQKVNLNDLFSDLPNTIINK